MASKQPVSCHRMTQQTQVLTCGALASHVGRARARGCVLVVTLVLVEGVGVRHWAEQSAVCMGKMCDGMGGQ